MHRRVHAGHLAAAAAAALTLAGCATRQDVSRPVPPAPSPAVPSDADIPTQAQWEALWHVRVGLNVAALICPFRDHPALTSDYNRLLTHRKAELATAYSAEETRFRTEAGEGWQQAMDRHMTSLYNRFANPTRRDRFCKAAEAVHHDLVGQGINDLPHHAERALDRLTSPLPASTEVAAAR